MTVEASDADLVARLGRAEEDALRALHRRYAALVFTFAARIVDVGTAEEVVQDVFITVWRKHATFDPARGSFKSWLIQVTRRRAQNALRAKPSRQHSDDTLHDLADDALEPDEAQWMEHRRAVVRAAVEALPEAQRQALSLAYFDELTHEQIARVLGAPLGTTKTRIRQGLKRLGPMLLAILTGVVIVAIARRRDEQALKSEEALRMVTASDVVPLRLTALPGVSADAHGSYRARAGSRVAVLTTSHLSLLDGAETYVAWMHRASGWKPLGRVAVESDGRSLLVADVDANDVPDEIRVTRELTVRDAPTGTPVIAWTAL